MLDAKIKQKNELIERSKQITETVELRSLYDTVNRLDTDITALQNLYKDEEARMKAQADADAQQQAELEKKAKEDEEARTKAAKAQTDAEKRKAFDPEGFNPFFGVNIDKDEKQKRMTDWENHGKDLKEKRAITLGSANIVVPTTFSPNINPTFNQVSSLIDSVNFIALSGGEGYSQPYEKGFPEGAYGSENTDYTDTDPEFDFASIAKSKVTAYTEYSEELLKLPNAPYAQNIEAAITKMLRKKITREILVGDGSTGHLVGIFSSKATAIDAETDLPITEIGRTTLDEIIFSYGGDENVEGPAAILIMNKSDLKAFSEVRSLQGDRFYHIVTNGNTGTIDGIPFVINGICPAFTNSSVREGSYCMAYGNPKNYSLTQFSPIEVVRSTDFKFKDGMIADRGSMFAGGNVTAYNGFLRVKKAASAT